jgi:hypothetical protein
MPLLLQVMAGGLEMSDVVGSSHAELRPIEFFSPVAESPVRFLFSPKSTGSLGRYLFTTHSYTLPFSLHSHAHTHTQIHIQTHGMMAT